MNKIFPQFEILLYPKKKKKKIVVQRVKMKNRNVFTYIVSNKISLFILLFERLQGSLVASKTSYFLVPDWLMERLRCCK